MKQRASIADQLVAVSEGNATPDWITVSAGLVDRAVSDISSRFDTRNGGIGPAPKFPQTTLFELCLRQFHYTGNDTALAIATRTVDAMAAGGIYDQLGGGFARYSVDNTWTVPHFEKMLYDQAGLVLLYLHAFLVTHEPAYLQIVEETIDYVLRDLTAVADGRGEVAGLCAAEDADSEGVEGLFYTWTPDEISAVLPAELYSVAVDWYGVTKTGNFEGRSILRRPLGETLIRPSEVERARAILFEARAKRVRPGRDDKVLTEWNAMFASALAQAAAATGRSDWADRATAMGEFLLTELRDGDGRFMRSWQNGTARHLAYASDYAWVIDCFTRLAELTGEARWLDHASQTAHSMLDLFGDPATGALWSTGSDADEILVRPIDLMDDATPSAASVASAAMLRLGTLTGAQTLIDAAERLLALMAPLATDHPLAVANSIASMTLAGGGILEVVVAGDRPDLVDCLTRRYEPNAVLASGEPTSSPLWQDRTDGAAYVCHRSICLMPARTPAELIAQLDAEGPRREDPELASAPDGTDEGKLSE